MRLQRQRTVICAILIATLMTGIWPPATRAFHPLAGTRQPGAQPVERKPLALIKSIIVNGQERTEANATEVEVVRAETNTSEPTVAAMRLYAQDQVTTGLNAQVTIMFLDSPAEKSNEVIVGSDSRIQISSIFTWWGKIFASVKGYFDVKSKPVNLGVKGTEFEFKLTRDGEAKLTVLEGIVEAQRTDSASLNPAEGAPPELRAGDLRSLFSNPLFSSFAPLAPQENRLSLEAPSGQTTTMKLKASLRNTCRQPRQFQISMPENMPWLTLMTENRVQISAGELETFSFEVKIDATNLPVALYQGEAIARCTDCSQEPACDLRYSIPLVLRVKAAGNGEEERPDEGSSTVQALEELTLKKGETSSKRATTEDQARSVLTWTNEVILTSQPTHAAENIIPHFASRDERSRAFADARFRAIWRREPGSFETLGDVYKDWGEGAKAVRSYEKELAVNKSQQDSPKFLTDLGEAYRLTGQFDLAEEKIKRALATNQQWAPGLNALGNLYLERASVARDRKDNRRAGELLENARTYYLQSFQTPSRRMDMAWSKVVPQANLGEVYTALGDLAQDEGRLQDARSQYEVAEQAFKSTEQRAPAYPFAATGLGQVYREMGIVAQSQNDPARARETYRQSEAQFNRALSAHHDLAAAYTGLGNLYEDTGREDDAVRSYTRATQVRPQEPTPYYNLSVLLKDKNPRLAAEYAQTYLRIERPVFKQGQKAKQAEVIAQGPVDPKTGKTVIVPDLIGKGRQAAQQSLSGVQLEIGRITERQSEDREGTIIDQNPRAGTSLPPGSAVDLVVAGNKPEVSTGSPPVKVPGVKGDDQAKAIKEIEKRGLKAEVKEQADCEKPGEVLYQEPKKDTMVPPGSTVTIFVASPGENAPRVPKLEGLQQADAERELRELGFNMKLGRRETDRVSPGTVMNQTPDAFTPLKAGCTVSLTVAIPVPLVEVPDFRGLTEAEALRRLPRILGQLSRGRTTYQEAPNARPGTVIDQDPAPGKQVPPGTRVNLVVAADERSTPPREDNPPRGEMLVVPDVRGRSEDDAKNTLTRAGFVPQVVPSRDRTEVDVVIGQSPAGGTKAARGTVVRLRMGRRKTDGQIFQLGGS